MSEANLYKYLRGGLSKRGISLQRIESPTTGQGIPDLIYCKGDKIGLIELKYVKTFPKRITTYIKIGLRPEQKAFLTKWREAPVFTLAQIADVYILFPSVEDTEQLRKCDVALLSHVWPGRIDFDQLIASL